MNKSLIFIYAVVLALGIVIGRSILIELVASELAKIHMPSINIPEGPLLTDLRLLLALPAFHYIAFGLVIIAFNVLAWWIGGAQNAKKIVIVDLIAITWGIISFLVTNGSATIPALSIGLPIALMGIESGELKEKELALPPQIKPLPMGKEAPWLLKGGGTQGSFNVVSQTKAMSLLSRGLPIRGVEIGVSDHSEATEVTKALDDVKAGVFDKIAVALGIRKGELPPYHVGVPNKLGAGIGSPDEASRFHNDVSKWLEAKVIPWEKEHWASHLLAFLGIGWTGTIYCFIRDSILATEGWAQRQYRVAYTHIATEPPRSINNFEEFIAFSDAINNANNMTRSRAFLPTFDTTLVSYEGLKPPTDRPWELLRSTPQDPSWKGRITREKAEMAHHMAFAIQSRAGIQPNLKEVTQLADLSPIRVIYVSERVLVTPLEKRLLKGSGVNEPLNIDGLRGGVRDVMRDLEENGVAKDVVLVCFGQLTADYRELIKAEAEAFGLDAKISVTGLPFGSRYSFVVGQGPVIYRPRFIDEPLGIWKRNHVPIEKLTPSNSDPAEPTNNQYLKVFTVYARALKQKSAYDLFSWKHRLGGA